MNPQEIIHEVRALLTSRFPKGSTCINKEKSFMKEVMNTGKGRGWKKKNYCNMLCTYINFLSLIKSLWTEMCYNKYRKRLYTRASFLCINNEQMKFEAKNKASFAWISKMKYLFINLVKLYPGSIWSRPQNHDERNQRIKWQDSPCSQTENIDDIDRLLILIDIDTNTIPIKILAHFIKRQLI